MSSKSTASHPPSPRSSTALRRQAEALVRKETVSLPGDLKAILPESEQRLLHELAVHQIELEVQNEELRASQIELDRSRAQYFDLYDLAPVGYCSISERGVVLQANLTVANILGVPRNALVGKPLSRFIFSQDVVRYHLQLRQILENVAPKVFELRMVKNDGSSFWGQLSFSVVKDEYAVTELRIAINDISVQKKVEGELEEQLAHLQSRDNALATITQGVVISGADQLITYSNHGFQSITGYSLADTVGRNCNFLQGSDTSRETVAEIAKALELGQSFHGEILNYRKDGSSFWNLLSITPVFDKQRRVTQFLGVQVDISENKRAENELRESEIRWQFAAEIHGDAMWAWDADKDALFLTGAARTLFNLPDIGSTRPIADLVARVIDDDRALVEKQIDDIIEGKSADWCGEYRLLSLGVARWIATRGRVMTRTTDGRPLRIVGISSDITQQRREAAEALRQRHLVEHQGRLVTLGEWASALAHEINQPLTAIAGFAAACARKTAKTPEVLELVRAIEEQAIRAGEIAWRMRGFARRQSIGRSSLSLAEVVTEVAKWMRMDSTLIDIVIDISRVDANLPRVTADRIELEQVLINLVQNGIEACLPHADGQIVAIAASIGARPDEIEVRVTDWGCGLPVSADFDAFQPFTSAKERGLGLGLTICFSIIEGLGGRLWSTPNPEGGTVFHFTLPMAV